MPNLKKIAATNIIINKWIKYLDFKNNIESEFKFLREILQTVMKKINNKNGIISLKNHSKAVKSINYISKIINNYPRNFNLKFFYHYSKFKLYLDMAKIKLSIIDLTHLVGLIDIYQSIYLFMDKTKLPKNYTEYLNYYNKFFNITRIESYTSKNKNNISFVLNTYGKDVKKTSISLASYQIDKPTINKYNTILKNIYLQVLGGKIYIPINNKLLILFGYFDNDHLNIYSKQNIFLEKYESLHNSITNLDVNAKFKMNYLKTLSISEFNINTVSQICNNCISQYNSNQKIKSWNISKIVKSFILGEDIKKYNIIRNLAIDTGESNSGYIANLLVELINSNDNILKINNILDVFHWDIRQILNLNKYNTNNNDKEILLEEIPYEKRIHLMKTSDSVKNKAKNKLKEINSGKPGESNNKATQYLEGLLKIPFGNYKKSSIKRKLEDLLLNIKKYRNLINEEISTLEENNILNDYDLKFTESLFNIIKASGTIKGPLNITKFINKIKIWENQLYESIILKNYYKPKLLKAYINKNYTSGDLKILLKNIKVKPLKTKKENTDLLISIKIRKQYLNQIIKKIKLKKLFSIIPLSNEGTKILKYIDAICRENSNYKKSQENYFKEIDDTLNSSIYGLDTAKLQIKRMIAQWINGKNEGYIFGFEGPPGTGKTTLAKQGIAKCLKDEFGIDRPFIFIPLGGSSNGSTLEGHNYTYVGSTWGRIVDGLMESKCMNPIIYIDELDKISKTEHGKELVGILTHLTDKSQNSSFMDKYFSGIKIDISKCMIIFSYNDPNLIDRILLDRIHRIEIKPLNKKSKIIVANKHLIPEILDNIGCTNNEILITDNEIEHIITTYTYEAGARKLKEKLYEIYRDINLKSLENSEIIPFSITNTYIDEIFHEYPSNDTLKIHDKPKVGTINGLFATATGVGGITIIETRKFTTNNHLELKLTGMQGDVMKESMEVAKTLALSIIPKKILDKVVNSKEKFGIHIHCPAGATKKDGPSAGTAITIAIISLLCDIPISNKIGITGEINLNGEMLPIGGLYSKIEGAKLAGIKKVLCPFKNKKKLDKILEENKDIVSEDFVIECKNNIWEAFIDTLLFKNKKLQKQFINL